MKIIVNKQKSLKIIKDIFLQSPIDGTTMYVYDITIDNEDSYSIFVQSEDGLQKWRHIVKTEEIDYTI